MLEKPRRAINHSLKYVNQFRRVILILSTRWCSVLCVAAPLYNHVKWLALQNDFLLRSYLASRVCINIYAWSHMYI